MVCNFPIILEGEVTKMTISLCEGMYIFRVMEEEKVIGAKKLIVH